MALLSTLLAWLTWKRDILVPMLILGFAGALVGQFRYRRPVVWGAGFGAMGAAAVILTVWVRTLFVYLRFGNHQPYMEDGPAELVIYPVIYFAIYVPFTAALGACVGLPFYLVNALAQLAKSNRSNANAS